MSAVLSGGASATAGTGVLAGESFFWNESTSRGVRVWRYDRSSQESTLLATIDADDLPGGPSIRMSAGETTLVAYSARGASVAISLNEGEVTSMQELREGSLVGIGGRGAYFLRVYNETLQGGESNLEEVLLSPVDGGELSEVWRGRGGQFLERFWEHGEGWLATGHYYGGSGRIDDVLVSINQAGRSRVVACESGPGALAPFQPILFDGSYHAVRTYDDGSWQVVSVPVEGMAGFGL